MPTDATPLTAEELAGLDEKCKHATRGNWLFTYELAPINGAFTITSGGMVLARGNAIDSRAAESVSNAYLMCAAPRLRATIDAQAAEIEALTREAERMQQEIRDHVCSDPMDDLDQDTPPSGGKEG